jgi:Mannanase, galactose-binding domain-like
MSSSNSNIFKGPLFQPTNPESVEVEEDRSAKGQFKFPITGRQAAMPIEPPAAGQQVLSQFNLPIASDSETSMFQFPDIEGQAAAQPGLTVTSRHHIPLFQLPTVDQGNSAHGPSYPVTNGHNVPPTTSGHGVPLFQLPTVDQGNSAHGPSYPVTNGHSVPPTTSGHGVPIFRLPTVDQQGNSAHGPGYPIVTGNVPAMQSPAGIQSMPLPSVSAFQVPAVSGAYAVPPQTSAPNVQPMPYSQPYPSVQTPVHTKVDTSSYPRPTINTQDVAVPRQPLKPLAVPGANPRLDKNMPFIALVFNVLLVVLVVWLTQNEIFMNANGTAGNLPGPNTVNTPLKRSLNDITNNKQISPLIFGTNMALFHANDEAMLNSPTTRQQLKDIGVRLIRMPIRKELSDSTTLAAAQVIKDVGAVPLAVIHGPEFKDGSILQDNEHALRLLTQVFGKQPIYCEFGNESDLNGIKVEQYIQIWNQVIPRLKQEFPTAHFIGPDNYQFTRLYLKTFLQHAQPLPDGVSWHEYTCSVKWTAAFCLSLLDTWSVHFSQARAAMHEAIGKELPIWISEWNYVSDQQVVNGQPINDGKYNNTSFMTTWTSKAMQTLIENRVFASMQYYATDAPMPLILGDHIGVEGQIFQQMYKKIMVDGFTPPMRSPQPPTPKPTLVPGQSFSFENGSTAGWMTVGAGVTQPVIATDKAFDGTHSLRIHLTNASETVFPYLAINAADLTTTPKAGQMLSGYLYVSNKAAIMNAKIFVAGKNYSWHFAGDLTMNSGSWSRVWYALPMDYSGTVTQIGIQIYTSTPGVATDIYFDAFGWN